MISDSSINQVRDLPPSEVIGHFVKLKKSGSNYIGSCPFHSEKTSSFHVNDVKGIYKCFGCGKSGDGIGFVMDHEKQSFADACTTIAKTFGIHLELEQRELSFKEKEILSAAQLQEQVLNTVIPIYQKNLFELPADHPVKEYLHKRGFDDELIIEAQIGWAGEDWHFIAPELIKQGLYEPAFKLGVIKRSKDDRNYDGYRSRITIPIKDWNGKFVGISGRFIEVDPSDKGKDYPKYINPADCELYNKSNVTFYEDRAAKAISAKGKAIVAEGNIDVIMMHRAGFNNTVGLSGTAFSKQQMQRLRKRTTSLLLMLDNDQAGIKAFDRLLPDLLKQGFKVERVKYEAKDPDEWVQSLDPEQYKDGPVALDVEDALLYQVNKIWSGAQSVHEKTQAQTSILELLCCIKNDILRINYLENICKSLKWKTTEAKKLLSTFLDISDDDDEDNSIESSSSELPGWVSDEEKDEFLMKGYLPVNKKIKGKPIVGYYTFSGGQKTEIANFIVTPLFLVYAGVESRYLLQIYNGYRHAVLDVPARAMPSIDQFQANTVAEGNYLIFGAKSQWLRIVSDLLQQFPRCMELRNLGWQSFSFFAYVNKVFIPGEGLKELDNWGIIKHKDEHFLIPASCEAYRQLKQTGDDPYENDRHLTYNQSPVTFEVWALQMKRVYKMQGVVGIAAVIMSIFRDLVFDVDNNCPHLYAFGEPSSGKSKWAESITAVFFHKRPAFNLNSGTDFAFFSYMQRYINCPAHLNEFEIEVIKPEWFEAIKGIFDGEGREKGKQNAGAGSRNRTEVMKVRSVLILTGQRLITANDNSVVTRSIIESFSLREDLSEEDKQAYTLLKEWEAKGLSSMLIELLEHREYVAANYKDNVNDLLSHWRKEKKDARSLNQRILQNFAHLATGYNIFSKFIKLPIDASSFTDYCYKQAHKWSAFIRNSDTLSEFWRTFEFLVSEQQVMDGWDYKIEELREVRVRVNRDSEELRTYDGPVKVLFLRLNNVHKLFQTAFRSRTGKEAMSIENMLHYFSSRKYFIGPVKSKLFKRFVIHSENKPTGLTGAHIVSTEKREQRQESSCYAFLYDDLNLEIEALDENENPAFKNKEIPFF